MRTAALVLAINLVAAPALAQSAAQVVRAQAGDDCPRCNLFQADLGDKQLKGRDYSGAMLRQSELSLSVFNHATFAGADLRDANGYGALFIGASFAGANMTNATFVGANLEGADFRGAQLSGVDFSGAEIDPAVGLSQGQLDEACGDAATRLPRGYHIRECR